MHRLPFEGTRPVNPILYDVLAGCEPTSTSAKVTSLFSLKEVAVASIWFFACTATVAPMQKYNERQPQNGH